MTRSGGSTCRTSGAPILCGRATGRHELRQREARRARERRVEVRHAPVVERAYLPRLEPAVDAVEVEGVLRASECGASQLGSRCHQAARVEPKSLEEREDKESGNLRCRRPTRPCLPARDSSQLVDPVLERQEEEDAHSSLAALPWLAWHSMPADGDERQTCVLGSAPVKSGEREGRTEVHDLLEREARERVRSAGGAARSSARERGGGEEEGWRTWFLQMAQLSTTMSCVCACRSVPWYSERGGPWR